MSRVVTTKEYEIQFHEVDYRKRLFIKNLIYYFNDCAMQQTEDLSMDLDYLNKNKIAWVIYKWDINIKRHPMYKEKIKVRTWAYSFRKFYAYRQHDIIDEEGNVICTANSIWFLINTEKRRPKKINEQMHNAYGIEADNNTPLEIDKIEIPSKIDSFKSFNVRYSDIDTNKHVNNAKYLSWAIESIPLNIIQNHTLKNINVCYEKETSYGEIIEVKTQIDILKDKTICIHNIVNKDGNRLARIKTIWSEGE